MEGHSGPAWGNTMLTLEVCHLGKNSEHITIDILSSLSFFTVPVNENIHSLPSSSSSPFLFPF